MSTLYPVTMSTKTKTNNKMTSFSSKKKIPSYKNFIPYHHQRCHYNISNVKNLLTQKSLQSKTPPLSKTLSVFHLNDPPVYPFPISKNTINIPPTHNRLQSAKLGCSGLQESSSIFSFKTKLPISYIKQNQKNLEIEEQKKRIHILKKKNPKRPFSSQINKKLSRFSDEPVWKKFLRGKLLRLIKKNIILCERKFNPTSFTESLSIKPVNEFRNKFRNLDNKHKVGIFTNKYPKVLSQCNHFYSRYFDFFISPDELLKENFTKEEIFQIKADPVYFNFGSNFENVNFFQKKTLKDTLNEEDKIGSPTELIDIELKKSLKKTKKRIGKYLDYYTSIMSQKDFLK